MHLCEPKVVPTIILKVYFPLNMGCQFNRGIEKHKKKSVGLGLV